MAEKFRQNNSVDFSKLLVIKLCELGRKPGIFFWQIESISTRIRKI